MLVDQQKKFAPGCGKVFEIAPLSPEAPKA